MRLDANRRLAQLVDRLRTSYWSLPALLAAVSVALAAWLAGLDESFIAEDGRLDAWLHESSVTGARALLTTLAGALITVAALVFSITMVALSFASSHLGPRVLRTFLRDRATQLVLGCFVATFLYCLVVLAAVERESVPRLAMTLGIVLATLSFGVLVYFVHHVATLLQADTVVHAIHVELDAVIDRLFPEDEGGDGDGGEAADDSDVDPDSFGAAIPAHRSGYVQVVDYELLAKLAERHDLELHCRSRAGQFVVEGGELVRCRAPVGDDRVVERVRRAFVIGSQRTDTQDVEFPIAQLVELAVRALSPGVNDPFTAIACVDHLGASLARFARRTATRYARFPRHGRARVTAGSVTFPGAMDAAWNQVRQHAARDVAVSIRVLEALGRIAAHLRAGDAAAAAAVRRHADLVLEAALGNAPQEVDRDDLAARHARVLAALAAHRG